MPLPDKGCAFLSVNDHDKPAAVEVGRRLAEFGFCLVATRGTAAFLNAAGLRVRTIFKVTAIAYRRPCITTMSAAKAVAEALASRRRDPIRVWSLQEIHGKIAATPAVH